MEARTPVLAWALAAGIAVTATLGGCSGEGPPSSGTRASYVDDATCIGCHEGAWTEWSGSHHDWSMRLATSETVLGDFDDAVFSEAGSTTRFFKRDGQYRVETVGADGQRAEFEVRNTLGFEPLQQYLVQSDDGRKQCLTIAWDTRRGAWFSLFPDAPPAPGEPNHWTGGERTWNAHCAACHSTGVSKGFDLATDSYTTTWAATNVGCQACHGPGGEHLDWATRSESEQRLFPERGLEVQLARTAPANQIDTCAACHARHTPLVEVPLPGDDLLDSVSPERLHAGLYFADGQVDDEVYVYGSFAQSRMHAAGVGCTDCHDAHDLGLRAVGNELCTRCHSMDAPTERFPTLRVKAYDTPRHHYHKRESPGAACVDCHMRERTYMQVDGRRDHSFRVPRPDLTDAIGVPNACNDCHTGEQDAAWAAEQVESWYGGDRLALPHFALSFARAREGDAGAGPALAAIAGNSEHPAIVRATALDHLRELGAAEELLLRGTFEDPSPLVRAAGVRAFASLPAELHAQVLPLVEDPVRAVRIEAVRVLAGLSRDNLEDRQREALDTATSEFFAAQRLRADLPEGHLELARFQLDSGNAEAAEASYLRALKLDPRARDARLELVDLVYAAGRADDAERLLREGLQRVPDDGEVLYVLGLLLAETGDREQAAEVLFEAAQRAPGRSIVQLEAGLALQAAGRLEDAERMLVGASLLAPGDPSPLRALVELCLQRGDDEQALVHARALATRVPNSPQAAILLERIRLSLDSEGGAATDR